MHIQIKNRWNGSVIFECEALSIKSAVELAIEKRISLSDADLSDADLSDANLREADLRAAKEDFISKLSKAKSESVGLYKAVVDGRIDGSCYTGECSCFCGTIATARGVNYKQLEAQLGIIPDGSSPVERWFYAIRKGDTPENNAVSAITVTWMLEFFKENGISVPARKVEWV